MGLSKEFAQALQEDKKQLKENQLMWLTASEYNELTKLKDEQQLEIESLRFILAQLPEPQRFKNYLLFLKIDDTYTWERVASDVKKLLKSRSNIKR